MEDVHGGQSRDELSELLFPEYRSARDRSPDIYIHDDFIITDFRELPPNPSPFPRSELSAISTSDPDGPLMRTDADSPLRR